VDCEAAVTGELTGEERVNPDAAAIIAARANNVGLLRALMVLSSTSAADPGVGE
jgi:hypothetical protein